MVGLCEDGEDGCMQFCLVMSTHLSRSLDFPDLL